MWQTLFLTVVILAFCLIFLAVRLLLGKKNFVSTHVEDNLALRKQGITCAKSQDKLAQNKMNFIIKEHS